MHATSSAEEEIVGEAVERPLLEAAGSSKTYFNDMGVCWKGYSESRRPQWNPVPRNLLDTEKISVIDNHCAPPKAKDFIPRACPDGWQTASLSTILVGGVTLRSLLTSVQWWLLL
eukprot:scpid111143/ scgid13064/ 